MFIYLIKRQNILYQIIYSFKKIQETCGSNFCFGEKAPMSNTFPSRFLKSLSNTTDIRLIFV